MTETLDGTPFHQPEEPDPKSIVDSVLNLDEFLAREVRLAVKQAAFYTRPDLEAELEELNAELDSITDANGRPLNDLDESLGGGGRSVAVVKQEILDKQREYAASRQVVLMQQLDEDDWAEFQAKWKDALAKEPPYPPEFYSDLICRTALKPRITPEQLVKLRKRVGSPVFEELWRTAWEVNTRSGVSIPKSWLASRSPGASPLS